MRNVGIELSRWFVRLRGGESRMVYGSDAETVLMLNGWTWADVWSVTADDCGRAHKPVEDVTGMTVKTGGEQYAFYRTLCRECGAVSFVAAGKDEE